MSDGANLPESVTSAGDSHPDIAVDIATRLLDWGATRVMVFTNESTGETSLDFASPLPGNPPQRAAITIRHGQVDKATLRLGVLDEDAFEGHPTHNPPQVRRLARIVQNLDTPGGSVVVNYGDDRYVPRPHILLNWVPSVAEPHEIVRKEPPEPFGADEFMRFLKAAADEIRTEFAGEFDADNEERMVTYPAKVRPDLVRPPAEIRDEIKLFYHQNARTYARVWERLDHTRQTWGIVTRSEKIGLLKASYVQSILSVRIPWERAEETFRLIMEGESIMDAWEKTDHGLFNKRSWMVETLAEDSVWEQAVDALDVGNADLAHDILLADAKGVGDAKAPFTIANLGFVQKMCIDGNISGLFEADQPSRLSTGEYEAVCAEVKDFFPELNEILRAYELQWLLFDYARIKRDFDDPTNLPPGVDPVAAHDVWFRYVPERTDYVARQMQRISREAKRLESPEGVPPDVPPDQPPTNVDVIGRSIDREIRRRLGSSGVTGDGRTR